MLSSVVARATITEDGISSTALWWMALDVKDCDEEGGGLVLAECMLEQGCEVNATGGWIGGELKA